MFYKMLSPVFKNKIGCAFYVEQCPTPRALPYTKKFVIFSPSQKKKNPSKYDFMKINIPLFSPLFFHYQ
jgi:hypothetical protein